LTRWISKAWVLIVVLLSVTHITACGGGSDLPFTFGDSSGGDGSGSENPPPPDGGSSCSANTDCTGGKVCNTSTHVCENPPATGCTDNTNCTAPQVCNTDTHLCQDPPDTGCTATDQCPSGQVCNTTTHACELPGACAVDLNATLALKIDDNFLAGHFDSPPKCCEYADVDGGSTCPSLAAGDIDHFLQSPSENDDLYCCSADSGNSVPGHPELFCDAENRHGGVPELAVTRWSANAGGKLRLKFAITNGGADCQVAMVRDLFPQFRLENSALDASLIIDAGKDYQNFPPNPVQKLNDDEIVAPCAVTTDGSGNVSVSISSMPLRFMTQLYENYKKCTEVDDLGSSCSSNPFTRRYLGETAGSYQIIPGFGGSPLTLTTGPSHVDPVNAANQPGGTMTIQGAPLHFDTADSKSKMSLVTSFALAPNTSTARDDSAGTGQLLAELGSAILTAEISGTVTKANGQPVQTLADLTTNCGTIGPTGPTGGTRLNLSMHSNFNAVDDAMTVTGDANTPTGAFTSEACIPGGHDGTNCKAVSPDKLPFAKDTSAGDPQPGTEAKFVKEGTIIVQNAADSSSTMTLQVPSKVGAFEITNSASLQNVPLAPGNTQTLNVKFEPETAAGGCTTTAGAVSCQAALTLSSSNNVTVTLKGQAKSPSGELKLEEIATAAPNDPSATLLPAASVPTVDFGEAILGGQTKTKLYKISNSGVRSLTLNGIQAADVKQNFRLGSVYQGADFQHRTWKIGQSPWTISPTADGNFFFFLNYGPFGKVTVGDTRSDAGALVVNTNAGVSSVNLTGSAKKDTRAALALYVEDPNRYTVTGDGDPDLKTVTEGADTKHLYLARDILWSFRQDNTPRVAYLFNNAAASNVDNLVISHLKFNADAGAKLSFAADANPQTTACLAAVESATAACATLTATGDTSKLKLGTVTFNATSSGSYSLTEGSLDVKAFSRAAGGTGDGAPPKVAGLNTIPSSPLVTYGMKGANGAPSGTFDLRVHRLIAGFSNKINQGLQKTLIVSDATKGILKRFNDTPATDINLDNLKDVFTLQDGMSLDPVTGQATLQKIVTAVDVDPNSPASPSTISGLRLYNAPGSNPGQTEYFAECVTTPTPPGHNCAFFYLYIGEWAGSTTSASCNGGTKFPVVTGYSGSQAERDAQFATVMKPDVAAEFACLSGPNGMKNQTHGIFDPVTGEITFNDLAVRLYAPNVPALSNSDVDATIRLTLTTGCVRQDLVPDTTARPQYLVPNNTLNDSSFNTTLMPTNPLTPYVDVPGTTCAARELHGRPMFAPDTTNTLDNDTDSDTLNFQGFDLAGVGRNVTSSFSVAPANMYIVIKGEAGHQCADGTWVQTGSLCSPPE